MTDPTDQLDVAALQVPDDQVLDPVNDHLTDADLQAMRDAQADGDTDPHAYAQPTEQTETRLHLDLSAATAALITVPAPSGTVAQMAARAVAWAASKVGAKESPAWSNHIFAWADVKPAWQGEPWCAAFVVDMWARQGVDLRKVISNPYYCPNLEAMAKSYGVWHAYGSGWDPKAGDISIMGRGLATHTGPAAPTPGSYSGYRQIEGNTVGEGASGSQTNGDGVYVRFRGDFIRGWIDMHALIPKLVAKGLVGKPSTSKAPAPAPAKPRPNISWSATAVYWGRKAGQKSGNIAIMQRALHKQSCSKNCPLTSKWDNGTRAAYKAYQTAIGYKGADADGIPGTASWNRLMKWAGYTPTK